ncbi:hypothetical protein [Hymenobacter arizonensis]|uniref:Uncharacterized protein n=1 Tax=Hymenobacter arizonensis TaxID=1227077 RepID=A0A1I6BCR0_HYMAR|nr:hypothetical protein [Hymenobacter arizonensis]SFQ78726.1 hypothetical protein SAMN04515668_4355 [Hymenobacter arizonensis]
MHTFLLLVSLFLGVRQSADPAPEKIRYAFSKKVEAQLYAVTQGKKEYYCVLYSTATGYSLVVSPIQKALPSSQTLIRQTSRFVYVQGTLLPLLVDYDFKFGVVGPMGERVRRVVPIQELSHSIELDAKGELIPKK